MGVFIHVLGDAFNNIAVIIAALLIWLLSSPTRFYADPALSTVIALMILASAIPLTTHTSTILLQSAPPGVLLSDIQHDLELIPGVRSVHELHVWRLDQKKAICSAHIVIDSPSSSTTTTSNDDESGSANDAGGGEGGGEGGGGSGSGSGAPDANASLATFMRQARTVAECLHAYGIHSATLQPELVGRREGGCRLACGEVCGELMCCS